MANRLAFGRSAAPVMHTDDGLDFNGWIQPPEVPPDPVGDEWRGEPGPPGPPGPGAAPSDAMPLMDGVGAAGTLGTASRGDHVHPSDTSLLPLTGGTLSDALTINSGTDPTLYITSTSGVWPGVSLDGLGNYIAGSKSGIWRWEIDLVDGSAETGGNAGSNFGIARYDDAGSQIGDYVLSISRATGAVALTGPLTIQTDGDPTFYIKSTTNWPGLAFDSPAGQTNYLYGSRNNLGRWEIDLGEASPETGGNAGSDFQIVRFDDAGHNISPAVVYISRATGLITLGGTVNINVDLAGTFGVYPTNSSAANGALAEFGVSNDVPHYASFGITGSGYAGYVDTVYLETNAAGGIQLITDAAVPISFWIGGTQIAEVTSAGMILAADPTAPLGAATKQYVDQGKTRGLVDVSSNAASPTVAQTDYVYLYIYGSPTGPATITMPVATTVRVLWTMNNTTAQPVTIQGTGGGTVTIPSGASQGVWTDTAGIYPLYNAGATRPPGDNSTFWATTAFVQAHAGGGGGGALSGITAATGANTLANGDNAQTWNWTLTTAAKSAFIFGETAAATNGAGNQFLVDIDTLAASTAGPLRVKAQGNTVLTIAPTGALTYVVPTNPTTNGNGLAINLTAGLGNGTASLGGAVVITGGANTATTASAGGPVTIQGGPANQAVTSPNGGTVTVQGGNSTVSSNGFGGAATFAGGDTTSASGAGGPVTVRGGNGSGAGATGGALTLSSGGGAFASGTVTLSSPNQTNGNAGSGNITIQTGTATNLGAPGNIAITAGNQVLTSGTAWNVNGGSISLTTGNGGYQNSNGGDYSVTLGAKAGTGRNGVFKITSLPTTDPGVTGALWLPATGAVAVSGTAQTQGVGTATNDNAAAGHIGEYLSATRLAGTAVALTTGVSTDILALSLTAGDWDVSSNLIYTGAGGVSLISALGWVNTASATLPTLPNGGMEAQWVGSPPTTNVTPYLAIATGRISIAATTVIYLSTNCQFSGGTVSSYGFIGARRAR